MVEGVYLASTHRFVFDVTGPPGSGEHVVATRFYVLSGGGRFHRGWGLPEGRLDAYDFAAAQADDAYNAGFYEVEDAAVTFRPVAGDAESGVLEADALLIENLRFERATGGPGRA